MQLCQWPVKGTSCFYCRKRRFEFECYDVGHLYNLAHMLDRKIVEPPLFTQTIFGILGGIGAEPRNLLFMKETADRLFGKDYVWCSLACMCMGSDYRLPHCDYSSHPGDLEVAPSSPVGTGSHTWGERQGDLWWVVSRGI